MATHSKESFREILLGALDDDHHYRYYLCRYPERANKQFYYITGGEFGAEQTSFDDMANRLDLAVVAKSRREGVILLKIVRMIIDRDAPPILCSKDDDDNVLDYNDYNTIDRYNDIISVLEKNRSCDVEFDGSSEELTCKLIGGDEEARGPWSTLGTEVFERSFIMCTETIVRPVSTMGLWDKERVIHYLQNDFLTDKIVGLDSPDA